MANITIAIDDELLRRARIKAVTEGTSVNEVCRHAIEQYAKAATASRYEDILSTLRDLGRNYRRDPASPLWPGREALYEGVLNERGLVNDPPGAATTPAPQPQPKPAARRR